MKTDAVASTSPVSNKGTVNSSSNASSTKPTTNSGTSKPSGSNTSSSSTSSSSGNSSSSSSKGEEHKHNYNIPITKTVHHDAVTKVVHHDAVTRNETVTVTDKAAYDEPVYGYVIGCNVCDKTWAKTEEGLEEAGWHSIETGHSYTNNKRVQTGTKHHDAVTHQETKKVVVTPAYDETVVVKQAYDETVTTGYRCSCGATK